MALTHVGAAYRSESEALGIQGMLAGTMVLTLDGALPVDYLEPGDRVVTRMGARRITRLEVTVVRHARVVQITHNTLGTGRPDQDMIVSAAQGILIRDWRAKALFGATEVVVPAGRLVDGLYARSAILAEARLYALGFEDATVIYAGGLELACAGATQNA